MELRPHKNERKGLYVGTEINEKWWRRYKKDNLFARGNGIYWYDEKAFYFQRYLTEEPIIIPLKSIVEFKTGKWHAGIWGCGSPILKIVWTKDGLKLSSGFILSKNTEESKNIVSELKNSWISNK